MLWIIASLCLPIDVVFHAVEMAFPTTTQQAPGVVLHGLFLFVGIDGVLLATHPRVHCWYRSVATMAHHINMVNRDDLWLHAHVLRR